MKIMVLYGGKSAEHEVSVHSAQAVCAALAQDYEVLPVFINKSGLWFLQQECGFASETDTAITPVINAKHKFVTWRGEPVAADLVFPVLHGTNGEDGTVQGLLEMLDLPYAGFGVLSAAAGMDKELSKLIARDLGAPVLEYKSFSKGDAYDEADFIPMGLPLFVKPNSLGSSIGVTKVTNFKDLKPAIDLALKFENYILVEKGVENAREVFCAVLGDDREVITRPCGELVKTKSGFFDYHTKYEDPGGCVAKVPADIPSEMDALMQDYSARIFKALRGAGLARADFLLDSAGAFYFSEINSMPGMSDTSLFPQIMKAGGVDYAEILARLIDIALVRHKAKASVSYDKGLNS